MLGSTTRPQQGSRLPRYSLPASCIPFFPACSNTTNTFYSAMTQRECLSDTHRWAKCLASDTNQTSLRAWSRIPATSKTVNNFSGTIMKRIGLPSRRNRRPSPPKAIEPKPTSQLQQPARRVRRRLESYEPSTDTASLKAAAMSRLEIASLKMTALSDVSQCIQQRPTKLTLQHLQQSRLGRYVQVVPLKRRHDESAADGNHLSTYAQCQSGSADLFLRRKSAVFATPKRINTNVHGPSSTKSPMSSERPVLSPAGISPAGISPAGQLPMAVTVLQNSISPTKIETKQSSPLKLKPRRISETVVSLSPVLGPVKAEPSPIKPASPANSPLNSAQKFANSPSTIGSGLRVVANAPVDLSQSPAAAATPCPKPVSQISSMEQPSPSKPSPAAHQTPSKPTPIEPSTPKIFNLDLTADAPSPLGALSSLFASPTVASPALSLGTPNKNPDFNFGSTSPSFNSVSWLQPAEAFPVRALKKASRRLSEPLIRNCFKSSMRRQSMSPQKLIFNAEVTFDKATSEAVSTKPANEAKPTIPTFKLTSPVQEKAKAESPLKKTAKSSKRKSVSFSEDKGNFESECLPTNEVLDIDMHENPDIFGAKSTPVLTSPPTKPLSIISETADEPVVEVTKKNTPSIKDAGLGLGLVAASTDVSEVKIFDEAEAEAEAEAEEPVVEKMPTPPTTRSSFTAVNVVEDSVAKLSEPVPTPAKAQEYDYDSPGRDYMREFIKRSKPKRALSATETGSPMPVSTRRQALQAKSPNTDSPGSNKRKSGVDAEVQETPSKKNKANKEGPSPKKAKTPTKSPVKSPYRSPAMRALANSPEPVEAGGEGKWLSMPSAADDADVDDDDDIDEEDFGLAPPENDTLVLSPTRRSSRIRNQERPVRAARPAPVKLEAGDQDTDVLGRTPAQITRITRKNTNANMNYAMHAKHVVARLGRQRDAVDDVKPVRKTKVDDRVVGWLSPIASFQEISARKTKTTKKIGEEDDEDECEPESPTKQVKKVVAAAPRKAGTPIKRPPTPTPGPVKKVSVSKMPSAKVAATKVPASKVPPASKMPAPVKAPAASVAKGIPRPAKASGIAKPVGSAAASRVKNGTPAKPQRVTRAGLRR